MTQLRKHNDPRFVAPPPWLESACRALEESLTRGDTPPRAQALATRFRLEERQFRQAFRAALGLTPAEYLAGLRAARFRDALRRGLSVADAVYEAGFASSSRAYEAAEQFLGMSPGQVRRGGEGLCIRWTIGGSALGPITIAATERGLCAVLLRSDGARDLPEARLRALFPQAEFVSAPAALAPLLKRVTRLVERPPAMAPSIPLDVRGTVFQRRVWKELHRIPCGETRSYGEIAHALGSPGAARAVGSACGANPVPLVVPCHRAVSSDGGLGGFAYGLDFKRSLLRAEGVRDIKGVSTEKAE